LKVLEEITTCQTDEVVKSKDLTANEQAPEISLKKIFGGAELNKIQSI
jgi:hypothetical protein